MSDLVDPAEAADHCHEMADLIELRIFARFNERPRPRWSFKADVAKWERQVESLRFCASDFEKEET